MKRIALWDNLKFILMALVVLGHFVDLFVSTSTTCQSIYIFIYAFHMPLFFFISGMFHKHTNVLKTTLFYISVGYALSMLLAVTKWFVGKGMSFELLGTSSIPWFMFVLAIYTALFHLLRHQNPRFLLVASVLLACFAGYDPSIGDFLYLSRTIVFFPFYLLGTMCPPQKVVEFRAKYRWLVIPAVLVLLFWAYLSFGHLEWVYRFRGLMTGRNPFSSYTAPLGGLTRLLCSLGSILTGAALVFVTPSKSLPLVSQGGRNTLNVYLWHWPIYLVLDYFFSISSLFGAGFWGKALFLLLSFVLTAILARCQIFSFPLKQMRAAIFQPTKHN